ncbi:MAG TPA: LacI family DNA-binding transcriptional regulator [Sphingobium sp.]|nr:LacI family DNA-binding transcriptional regulator [Sphingobium sp.]
MRDVAARVGVSAMSVSRVLNGADNVSEDLRRRVLAAVQALGYRTNLAARSLKTGDQLRLGLIYDNPSSGYLTELLLGSLDAARRSRVQLIVQACDEAGNADAAIDRLIAARADGFVLTPPISESKDVLDRLRTLALPVVSIASAKAPDWALSVCIDERRAAFQMTRHLIERGHARIGFITGDARQSASALRLQGYLRALAESGLPRRPELIASGHFTYRSGLDAAEELLDLPERPTAIFASNDDMAAACIAIAHQRGLDVPHDLSVCGFDDTALATTVWPELTTIRQPINAMSAAAVALLARTLRQESPDARKARARHLRLGYEIKLRGSDGPAQ